MLIGRVLGDDGFGYDTWILAGMSWAQEQGARVISISIGGARAAGDAPNVAYQRVIDLMAQQGVAIVMAAGNDSARPNVIAPINSPGAMGLSIAAVDDGLAVADFSCGQVAADWANLFLAAPGVDVWSAWIGSSYRSISGTSMATPHVAGVVALMLQRDPKIAVKDLVQALKQQAKPLQGPKTDVGGGLVQAP